MHSCSGHVMLQAASFAITRSHKTHNLLFISREITVVVMNVITRCVTRHCKLPLLHLVERFSWHLNTDDFVPSGKLSLAGTVTLIQNVTASVSLRLISHGQVFRPLNKVISQQSRSFCNLGNSFFGGCKPTDITKVSESI